MFYRGILLAPVLILAGHSPVSGADNTGAEIVLSLAGEAFEGPPEFEVRMGTSVIGTGTVTGALDTTSDGRLYFNPEPLDFVEQFTFRVTAADFEPTAAISVALTNDRYSPKFAGHDRNLFVQAISVNGMVRNAGMLQLEKAGEVDPIDYQAGLMPVYDSEHVAVARAPAEGWPAAQAVDNIPTGAVGK
jgi:hypothetical protein